MTLPYTALMNRLYWQWKELPYNPTENFCVFKTALTFVDSICEIWGPLLQSRTLIVLPKHVTQNPEKFIHVLEEYKVCIDLNEESNYNMTYNFLKTSD